jgi:hypothetical protein
VQENNETRQLCHGNVLPDLRARLERKQTRTNWLLYKTDITVVVVVVIIIIIIGCNWPFFAVVKHVNKRIELNYYWPYLAVNCKHVNK